MQIIIWLKSSYTMINVISELHYFSVLLLSDVTADRLYESWLDVADMSGLSQEEREREVGVCRRYKDLTVDSLFGFLRKQ